MFVTVDCAVLGRRLNEARNDFKLPNHVELPNLPEDLDWRALDSTDDRLKYDAALSWKTLVDWAKESTKLEIWLKGGEYTGPTRPSLSSTHPFTDVTPASRSQAPPHSAHVQCTPPRTSRLRSTTDCTESLCPITADDS